jgi:ADP-L-glycero-D-manno-heptose 6-epimerase
MIIVTGGEGFIGSNLVLELKKRGYEDIMVLDTKTKTLEEIYEWITTNINKIHCIFHLGGKTDTKIVDPQIFEEYNIKFSMFIWEICSKFNITLIYASSGLTYGNCENGTDDTINIRELNPISTYGLAKHKFDLWNMEQKNKPQYWYGLKFFNVYGLGKGIRGNKASAIYRFYNNIKDDGFVPLYKSDRNGYEHGEQKRDFIFVEDVVDICIYFMTNLPTSGIYNVGTGKARSFNDFVSSVFRNMDLQPNIHYIEPSPEIKNSFQYFTQANITKLRNSGYQKSFTELETGIKKCVDRLKIGDF